MGKPKAPEPPNPKDTSQAQTGTNIGTAIANAFMGNVNQVTPDGKLTFNQSGSYVFHDPYTGQNYTIPKFTATQQLSDTGRTLKGLQDKASIKLAGLGNSQLDRLKGVLGKPFDINNIGAPELRTSFNTDFSKDRQRVEDALMARLQPQLDRDRIALETKLSNQGIKLGSTAFDRGMDEYTRQANDARLGAIINAGQEQSRLAGLDQANAAFQNSARGQFLQEQFANRSQPLNEIASLLSGSQVQQPNFINPQMPTIPTTDVAGLINTNFDQKMGVYNSKVQQRNNILGGLFSLGGSLAGAFAPAPTIMVSDRRAKKDVERVGRIGRLPVYRYRYKDEVRNAPKRLGFMAQDVEKVRPGAVINVRGVKMVDYGKAMEAA